MNPTPLRDRLSALLVAFVREAAGADLSPLTLRDFVGNMVVEVRVRPEQPFPAAWRDDVEPAVLELLAGHGRLRTCELVRLLVRDEVCAVATVKRRLSDMVRRRVIVSCYQSGGVGYRLPTAEEGRASPPQPRPAPAPSTRPVPGQKTRPPKVERPGPARRPAEPNHMPTPDEIRRQCEAIRAAKVHAA